MHAFFCHPLPSPGSRFELPPGEAEHLFRVFRAAPGAEVALLDGEGGRGYAKILPDKTLEMERTETLPPPEKELHLYTALPRRNQQDELFKQCVSLGVTAIHPVRCERSVALSEPTPRREALLREACKQSGNPFLPVFTEETSLGEALRDAQNRSLALAYGSIRGDDGHFNRNARGAAWFVGPEGGFSPDEIAALRGAGACGINLGPYVLRLETAAITGIAVLRKLLVIALLALFLAGCGERDVGATPLMVKGNRCRDAGDAPLAEKYYLRASHKYPDAPEPLLALAALYDEELNRPLEALYFYRQYLERLPADHPDRVVIGRGCERLSGIVAGEAAKDTDAERFRKEIVLLRRIVFRQQETIRALRTKLEAEAPARADAKYTVRPGDTLAGIAAKTGVPLEALRRANRLDRNSMLRVGDVLILPGK